jgi:hypothetical protein
MAEKQSRVWDGSVHCPWYGDRMRSSGLSQAIKQLFGPSKKYGEQSFLPRASLLWHTAALRVGP